MPDHKFRPGAPKGPQLHTRPRHTQGIGVETGKLFDSLIKDAGSGIQNFLQELARRQLPGLIQNIAAALFGGMRGQPSRSQTGLGFGQVLEGTLFGRLPENAGDLSANVAALQANTAALEQLTAVLSEIQSPLGDSPFLQSAFGSGGLGGIFGGGPSTGMSFGGTGGVLGATVAGAIFGAKGSGFGLAGLGSIPGALLGGALTGGLTFGLLGLKSLFGGKSPQERQAEIERVLEGQRFTFPQTQSRDLAFGPEGSGQRDFGSGDQPRLIVNMNVSAMDSRSFLDQAPALAQAVREAMLHMHPINQLVRESF